MSYVFTLNPELLILYNIFFCMASLYFSDRIHKIPRLHQART